ncbi:MAG: tetratricopeptide (TPR) repeat protein [bacterium]|jgi:tetratricopeptide (TPR) repeat protein
MNNRLKKCSLPRRLMTGLTPLLLLGCSTVQMAPGNAFAQSSVGSEGAVLSQEGMDSQLMFEIMISELAGRRGQLDIAMTGYLRASERTDDPRVSERATRLATFGRQWEAAELASTRWQVLDTDSIEAPQFLGQALLRQGKAEEAADQYIAILEKSDNKEETLREIQATVQGASSADEIVNVMRRMQSAYPEIVEAHLAVARALVQKGDNESALIAADQAMELDSNNTPAILLKAETLMELGRPDEGLYVVDKALEAYPDNQQVRLGYAQILVEAGRFDAVSTHLDKLFISDNDNPVTLLALSSLALDARRVDRARIYLGRLLEIGEYQDQANYYLARISDQQQNFLEAINYYDAVVSGDLQLRSQIRVAELLGLLGDVANGRERLRDLATTNQDPTLQARIITAESRVLQTAGRGAEAVIVLTDGLGRFPDNGDLLYARALAADVVGDQGMLVSDLTKLIELQPQNAHALNALGYHLTDNNLDLERAETLLVTANKLLPNDPAIMDSLGWLFYRQGKLDQAIELLSGAFKLYPDSEIAAHLGEALWLSGRVEEATQLIEEALLSDPEDDKLLQVKRKYSE